MICSKGLQYIWSLPGLYIWEKEIHRGDREGGDNILQERTSKTMSKTFLIKWMWIYCLNESGPIHHLPMNDRSFNTGCLLFLCSHIWHLKETEKNIGTLQRLTFHYSNCFWNICEWQRESLEDSKNVWHFIRKLDHEVSHLPQMNSKSPMPFRQRTKLSNTKLDLKSLEYQLK